MHMERYVFWPPNVVSFVMVLIIVGTWMTLALLAARHEFKHKHPIRGTIAVVLAFVPLSRLGWV